MSPSSGRRRRAPFQLGDLRVGPGRAAATELPISRLVTGTQVSLPVRVVHGVQDGPTLWLSAAVHGDEIGGVEVIRRVLAAVEPRELAGTIVAVPIVNVHGFLNGDRYLPDRRDLNRSFPGSPTGSLAARIAHLFMTEIVARADVGIDLHTGSDHRTNLPQIRADLDDPATHRLAAVFGAPVMLHARLRDGSMRAAATAGGATVLLYEGGEAWRFDEAAIAVGVDGVVRVLGELGMTMSQLAPPARPPVEARRTTWVRARRSGIAHLDVGLGVRVERGDVLATIRDALGRRLSVAKAGNAGIVIGHTQHPLVNQGDALIHLAEPIRPDAPAAPRTADSSRPPEGRS